MEELEKIKAKLKSRMVTLSLEGAIWPKSALRQQLKTPMDKLGKEKAKEMVEHVTKCHRTKLKLDKEPCSGCLAGNMRARKAMTGRATKIRQFLTMNSDYIEYPGEADNNGNTKVCHSVVLPDLLGVALPNRTVNAMSTTIRWKKAKAWFESRADPGGIKGIKIQRHHHDPGSENKGVLTDTLAEFNMIDSSGGTDIHTDGAFIENANRTLQTMQLKLR